MLLILAQQQYEICYVLNSVPDIYKQINVILPMQRTVLKAISEHTAGAILYTSNAVSHFYMFEEICLLMFLL
jgi:hypothetical protein